MCSKPAALRRSGKVEGSTTIIVSNRCRRPNTPTVTAIRTCKDAAWAQDTRDLHQQLVLQCQRWNMMQHGEGHASVEGGVGQRHRGGTLAQDGHIPALIPAA